MTTRNTNSVFEYAHEGAKRITAELVWQVYEEDEWRPKSEERKDVKLSRPIMAL